MFFDENKPTNCMKYDMTSEEKGGEKITKKSGGAVASCFCASTCPIVFFLLP